MKYGIKNIEEIIHLSLCTGCGICASICPQKAIVLAIDPAKGLYVPKIQPDCCNFCGICVKICPGHEVDFINLNSKFITQEQSDPLLGSYIRCYTGYSNDNVLRYRSSSGGLITAFLIFALEQNIIDGAVVTRMNKDNPLVPEPFIARTKDDLLSAIGSKYCPVPVGVVIREILETEGKYAIVGLPCHIQGIRKAEVYNKILRERVKIHVGIICGTTKTFLGTEFQLDRLQIKKDLIKKIEYRGNGWPGQMTIFLKDNREKIQTHLNSYYDCLFRSFTPKRCMLCIDQANELSDICFGDAWIEKIQKNDKIGSSIIISRNPYCESILKKMIDEKYIELQSCDIGSVIESQRYFEGRSHFLGRQRLSSLFGIDCPHYTFNPPKFHYSRKDGITDALTFLKITLASNKFLSKGLGTVCNIQKIGVKIYKFFYK